MKFYIQNRMCFCCEIMIASELNKIVLFYNKFESDKAKSTTKKQKTLLKETTLHKYNLKKLVSIIVNLTHDPKETTISNFLAFFSTPLNQDYHYLSQLFSKAKEIISKHSILLRKIRKRKKQLCLIS